MNTKTLFFACKLLFCIAGISCEKVQTPVPSELKLKFETLKVQNAIPKEYGELESVVVDSPNVARMFFENEDKSIVVVTVNLADGTLRDQVLVIPRK